MAQTIDARVKQKTGTAADFAGYTLLEGEIALVRTIANGPVWNFKVGPGNFDELDWSLQNPGAAQEADTSTVFPAGVPGLYIPTEDGTYEGVTVDLSAGYTQLIWDGSALVKVEFPIDLSGYATIDKGITGSVYNTNQLNNLRTTGVYKYVSTGGGNTYEVAVSVSGDLVRQYRINPNPSGVPYIAYRDWNNNDETPMWTEWMDALLPIENNILTGRADGNAQLDNIRTTGVYKFVSPIPGGNTYFFEVVVSSGRVRQYRINPNINSGRPPYLSFREWDDNDPSPAWTAWSTEPFVVSGASDLDSTRTTGVYKYVPVTSSGNTYEFSVSVSGDLVRQYRLHPNPSGVPYIAYRDWNNNDETPMWTEWMDATPSPSAAGNSVEPNDEDVIWSWWNYPTMIRPSGREFDKIYQSFTDSGGNTGVVERNLDTGSVGKSLIKTKILDIDDHNAGAVLMLPDGRLITAFTGGHNADTKMHVHRSVRKETGLQWEQVADITLSGRTTYNQMMLIGGVLYLFCRLRTGTIWRWIMITSSDLGETWSAEQTIINGENLQWYCIFRPVAGDDDLIRIVHYSNPNSGETGIRGGFIKISTNEVLDNEMSLIGAVGADNLWSDFDVMIPAAGSNVNRLFDVGITDQNDWQILYCQFTNQFDGQYYHYDNGTDRLICAGGKAFYTGSRYYGGAVFAGEHGIATSRFDDPNWKVELYELSGGNYVMAQELASTTAVAVRPLYDNGIVSWQQGYYNQSNFSDFLTQMKYVEL